MLETILNEQHFYFSYTYDLTHSLQRIQDSVSVQKSIFDRVSCFFLLILGYNTILTISLIYRRIKDLFGITFCYVGLILPMRWAHFFFQLCWGVSIYSKFAVYKLLSRHIDNYNLYKWNTCFVLHKMELFYYR